MTKRDVLSKVRVLLGLHKFDDATLADGTKITNKLDEAFAPGQDLFVLDAEGNEVPAPEGEHTTESGIVLTVDAEGKITGVKEPDMEGEGSLAAAEEEDKEKMYEESPAEKVAEAAEDVAAVADMTGMTPEEVLEMVTPIVEEISMLKEEIETMKKDFEEYKDGPAKESMKKSFSKLNFGKSNDEVIDTYAKLANLRKEFSKK